MGIRLRCRSRQNLKRYYNRNQQYSITAITDGSGGIVERYAYTAYGTPTITDASGTPRTTTAVGNRYTYTGREYDETLALYHYRARMYDSVGGRFCSKDPIGYAGSEWSLYEYVDGEPLRSGDPSGMNRYLCWIGPHAYLRVDVYDARGRVVGCAILERSTPWVGRGPNGSCWTINRYDSGSCDSWYCSETESTQEQDEELLDFWRQKANDPTSPCNYLVWNPCFLTAPYRRRHGMPSIPIPQPRGHWERGCCFVGGTSILMADGSSKLIEEIVIGDAVMSYEFRTNKMVAKTVFVIDNPVRSNVVDLELSTVKNVSSTTDHPYWVHGKGWCSVDPAMTLSHYQIFVDNGIVVQNLEAGDELVVAGYSSSEARGSDSVVLRTCTLESISRRDPTPTSLWIIRVGDYGSDWRRAKQLHEAALASEDFSAYYQEMGKAHSREADPNDHNFFANGILVHNK